jgi:hypothetical protein
LVQLLIAVKRRNAKRIAFNHNVPGLVSEQFVRRTGNDPQAGAQFYHPVIWLYPAPDQFSLFPFVITRDEARPVGHGCDVLGDHEDTAVGSKSPAFHVEYQAEEPTVKISYEITQGLSDHRRQDLPRRLSNVLFHALRGPA